MGHLRALFLKGLPAMKFVVFPDRHHRKDNYVIYNYVSSFD